MTTIPQEITHAVGFVVAASGKPVGTFSVVSTASGPVMLTAAHVLVDHGGARARIREESTGVVEWEPDAWLFPDDPHLDLAAACFSPPTAGAYRALPFEHDAADVIQVSPKLGGDILYVGLLTGVEEMGLEARPVVRRGSVAALDQRGVSWDGGSWTSEHVHLVDIRGHGGFSGSPCLVTATYPGPRLRPLPPAFAAHVERNGGDPNLLGDPYTFGAFWGVYVAAVGTSGIGVVIPVRAVREFLDNLRAAGDLQCMAEWIVQSQAADGPPAEAGRAGAIHSDHRPAE